MSAAGSFAAVAGGVKNLGIGLAVLGVLGAVVLVVVNRGKILAAINPANADNIVNTTVNDAIFPNRDASIGTWIYDVLHPNV